MIPYYGFADGGLIGTNPSVHGGTWAWIWVGGKDCQELKRESGIILPEDIGLDAVSNNISELYAALMLIESLPKDWHGTLFTDSEVTQKRLLNKRAKFTNTPEWLVERVQTAKRVGKWKVSLLAGHPTRADLKRGYKQRNKLPVSIFNKECDLMCTRLAKEFKLEKGIK